MCIKVHGAIVRVPASKLRSDLPAAVLTVAVAKHGSYAARWKDIDDDEDVTRARKRVK